MNATTRPDAATQARLDRTSASVYRQLRDAGIPEPRILKAFHDVRTIGQVTIAHAGTVATIRYDLTEYTVQF